MCVRAGKLRGGSSGADERASVATNAAISAVVAATRPTVTPLPQPSWLARVICVPQRKPPLWGPSVGQQRGGVRDDAVHRVDGPAERGCGKAEGGGGQADGVGLDDVAAQDDDLRVEQVG